MNEKYDSSGIMMMMMMMGVSAALWPIWRQFQNNGVCFLSFFLHPSVIVTRNLCNMFPPFRSKIEVPLQNFILEKYSDLCEE